MKKILLTLFLVMVATPSYAATLYIEYYRGIATGASNAQVARGLISTDKLTIGASSVRTSSDIPDGTEIVVLKSDTAAQYEFGTSSVTADANSQFISAGSIWSQTPDGAARIAVIQQQ